MEYKVEKGVPIPGRGENYPFLEMEVGDSFFVPAGERVVHSVRAGVWSAIKSARKNGGVGSRRFITRAVNEGGVDGVRCWRAEDDEDGGQVL